MARVGRTLAFVSFMLSVTLPLDVALAQTPDTKAEEPKKKRAAPAKKAGEQPVGEKAKEAKKAADPAAVQKSLDAAQKAMDGGKADVAVNQVNSLIGVGGLDARSMARALALRGQAYRRQGKPAQAISDLQSAIWLKGGLNEAERATALQARADAYREAGLGEPPSASSGKSAPATGAQKPSASTSLSTAAVAAKPESAPAASGGGGFFSNLFGGSPKKQAVAEPSPVKAPADPAVSSWTAPAGPPSGAKAAVATSAAPKVAPPAVAAAPVKTASIAAPAAVKVPEAAAGGGFKIQLAAMRTREEAQALVERVKRENASLLGARAHLIEETKFGNMGVFYRPRFGAFASANDAKSACANLRGKGVDCLASE